MRQMTAALRRRAGRDEPRLTVVVPVYNVERYVGEALDSLLAQSFADFEVVVVIDGATDGSAEIARRRARADRRIRLVHQLNAGLSAARNKGVAAARGEYLTFLDSDDLLPPHAYAEMMQTIERTGSDMVVGRLVRGHGRHRQQLRLMEQNHRVRQEGLHLVDAPLMLADVFAVNKIYRRSFWTEAELSFPEGIRYEDQPTLTRALLAAGRFDVIPETVYLWRVRDDESSITQRRHELPDLLDRLESKRISTRLVRDSGIPGLADSWFGDILPVDMWEYFRGARGASEDYWDTLRRGLREFWNDDTLTFDRTRVPVQQRLMGWLVDQDRRADLEELLAFLDERRGDVPVEVRNDHVVALLPGVDDPDGGVPSSASVLGDHEHPLEARVTGAVWEQDVLQVNGFALIRNVPTARHDTEVSAGLELRAETVAERVLDVEASVEPRATSYAGNASRDFDATGFRLRVDARQLATSCPHGGVWSLVLRRRVGEIERAGPAAPLPHADVDLDWHPLDEGVGRVRLAEQGDALVVEHDPG